MKIFCREDLMEKEIIQLVDLFTMNAQFMELSGSDI